MRITIELSKDERLAVRRRLVHDQDHESEAQLEGVLRRVLDATTIEEQLRRGPTRVRPVRKGEAI